MSIVRFEPFRGFEDLSHRDCCSNPDFWDKGISINEFTPKVDIGEDEKALSIHCEIPGINKDDVKISISDDNILTIKGEKKREEKCESKNYVRFERSFGSFSRSFMLPDHVDQENINAKFENGILSIDLPKIEPTKPKEIEIAIA